LVDSGMPSLAMLFSSSAARAFLLSTSSRRSRWRLAWGAGGGCGRGVGVEERRGGRERGGEQRCSEGRWAGGGADSEAADGNSYMLC
jgi:hypothetical protein